jgi:hypothetical protein
MGGIRPRGGFKRWASDGAPARWVAGRPALYGLVFGAVVGAAWLGATWAVNDARHPRHGVPFVIGLSVVVGVGWGVAMYVQASQGSVGLRRNARH